MAAMKTCAFCSIKSPREAVMTVKIWVSDAGFDGEYVDADVCDLTHIELERMRVRNISPGKGLR